MQWFLQSCLFRYNTFLDKIHGLVLQPTEMIMEKKSQQSDSDVMSIFCNKNR